MPDRVNMGRFARRIAVGILAGVLGVAGTAAARAACPDDADMVPFAAKVIAGVPAEPLPLETLADGKCAQDKLVRLLEAEWGKPVGYKAGLTNPAVQKRFGVDTPVSGVLLSEMMLRDGARLPADFTALPRFEADLVVVVADAAINDATTPDEVLAHLSAIHPFIELPGLVVTDPSRLDGPIIASINVGARYGVLGAAIEPGQGDGLLDALREMTVTVSDQTGAVLASATGAAVLDHPLNAVLWLRDSGIELKPGDLVSVGSFGPLLPPRAGMTATVRYEGLPGNPEVGVTFD